MKSKTINQRETLSFGLGGGDGEEGNEIAELQQKIDMFEMALDQRDRVIESLEKHIEQLKKDN